MSVRAFPLRRRAAVLALLALGATAAAPALATDPFPSRPITLVLPFPAGGSFDPIFRTLAEAAAKDLGQPVVLQHKPVGLVAPKNLDPMIAARLAAAFRKAAADPAYLNQLEQYDMQPNVIGGEAYAAYAKLQFERDAKMLADIGFKPE
jgi:tripartite-type tricarboxylate transporter receptor subunit TctC